MTHANAPLTRTGHHRMVALVEEGGLTFEAAAAASNVAKSTVHLWVSRWRAASPTQRATLVCLEDRSSRPRRSPTQLSGTDHDRVCEVRERTGWGPRLIASEVGLAHATVHRALRRRGCSRGPRQPREAAHRYEWPCPGNLLHMDTKRHACFLRPGHAVTGDRTSRSQGAGWEWVHTVVDDCSRLAYAEVHRDERATTVTAFCEQALDSFADHGIVAERLLTDNHFSYVKNRGLRELLRGRAIEHWTTPRTNGKVERLQQTMDREWARGLTYRSSADRRRALPHWLDHYNGARRHSALGNRPPLARVRDVLGHDTYGGGP